MCSHLGCDTPDHARGMCKAHYSAWYRQANPAKVETYNRRRSPKREAECPHCGQAFQAGAKQIYCTDRCQRREGKKRERAKVADLVCDYCGTAYRAFPHARSKDRIRRYCSPQCQAEGKRWSLRKVFSCPVPWAKCRDCGAQFVSRQGRIYCAACWVEPAPRLRPAGVWYMGCCAECSEPFVTRISYVRFCGQRCKSNAHRRDHKQRKRDGFVERVFRRKVYERDDWTCRICGKAVDKTAQAPAPLAPTLDHIIPVALGGQHSYPNVQCAHFICNSAKGANLEGQLHFAA